jgi:uncharacterized RDD family membrane protein YckC
MTVSIAPEPIGPSLAVCIERAQGPAPKLSRRMAAFLYEGVLLFGLVNVAGWFYSISTHQTHALHGREGMMATQFVAMALYFMWFWTRGGQTLAMKTWHIKVVSDKGLPISLKQALMRYLTSWLWFMPPWAAAWLAGWHQSKLLYGAMGVWLLIYTALTWLLPQGQFLHDAICRTRLIDTRSSSTSLS